MSEPNGVTRRGVLGLLAAVTASPMLATRAIASRTSWRRATSTLTDAGNARAHPRFLHAAVTLNDGRIVVIGGYGVSAETRARATSVPTSSVQMLDPETGEWYDLPPLRVPRARHAAVLLRDGRIAVLGGMLTAPLDSVEVFDPRTGQWSMADALPMPLVDHSANLAGEHIVITGGQVGVPALMVLAPRTQVGPQV